MVILLHFPTPQTNTENHAMQKAAVFTSTDMGLNQRKENSGLYHQKDAEHLSHSRNRALPLTTLLCSTIYQNGNEFQGLATVNVNIPGPVPGSPMEPKKAKINTYVHLSTQ